MSSTGLIIAKVLMGIISVGCIIGGIVALIMASEGTHEHLVADFRSSLQAWRDELPDFQSLSISVRFGDGQTHKLVQRRAPDPLRGTMDAWDLPAYEELIYELPRLTGEEEEIFPVARFENMELKGTNELVGTTMVFSVLIGGHATRTPAISLLRAKAHQELQGSAAHCQERRGVVRNGMCWVYERLQRVSMQVKPSADGPWTLAPRVIGVNTTYGCNYDKGQWTAPSYAAVPPAMREGIIHFTDLEVHVRSHLDPYLRAMELTDGTLDFGMPAEDEDTLAVIFFVLGVLFACPPGCALARYCFCKAPRYPRYQRSWRGVDPEMLGFKRRMDSDDDVKGNC